MAKQAAEILHPANQGVQFIHGSFVPLGESIAESAVLESALPKREPEPETNAPVEAPRARVPAKLVLSAPAATVTPATVLRSAKARIKELKAFLKTAKAAEKELIELERLVAAAKKPLAAVREIRRSAN
jgi:hypothetical protein